MPFSSRTVAYWLLARGQELRLHRPVRLYSWRQNFCVSVLMYFLKREIQLILGCIWTKCKYINLYIGTYVTLCEQNDLLIMLQMTWNIHFEVRLFVLHYPESEGILAYIVVLHFRKWVVSRETRQRIVKILFSCWGKDKRRRSEDWNRGSSSKQQEQKYRRNDRE